MELIQNIKFTWVSGPGYRGGIGTLTGKFLNTGPEYWFEGFVIDPENGDPHLIYGIYVEDIGIELFEAPKNSQNTYRFVAVKTIGEENYHGQFYYLTITKDLNEIDGIDYGLFRMSIKEVPDDMQSISTFDDMDDYELQKSRLSDTVDILVNDHLCERQKRVYRKVKSDYKSRKINLASLYTQAYTSKKMKL